MSLVAKEALDTDETRAAVAAFHGEQQREVDARVDEGTASMEDAAPGRIDFIMAAILGAVTGAMLYTAHSWRGYLGVALGVVITGRRLARGLAARRAAKARISA